MSAEFIKSWKDLIERHLMDWMKGIYDENFVKKGRGTRADGY